jgi:SpoVK/Ycf46/Vps4 family AAA+-type ATPase
VPLFDEADALFGKRREVKDAHDRYANVEGAYLPQRMEALSGVAILTNNNRQSLDTAFRRRLQFVVDLPVPDAAARERIWTLCLPDAAPVHRESDGLPSDRRLRVHLSVSWQGAERFTGPRFRSLEPPQPTGHLIEGTALRQVLSVDWDSLAP